MKHYTKLILLAAGLVLGFIRCPDNSETAAKSIELVRNGRSDYAIVISAEATQTEQFAAAELQRYLEKMTDCILPIETEAKKAIFIGKIADDFDESKDGFAIRTIGENLYIAGSNDRSVLYGVYDFLESLSCRWYAPDFAFYGEGGREIVPWMANLEIEPLSIRETASFQYRTKNIEEGWSHNTENLLLLIDWMGKNKMNVISAQSVHIRPIAYEGKIDTIAWDDWREALIPELKKRGIRIAVGGHGYQNYLRQSDYFDEHPEWFGMKEGQRSSNHRIVFCSSNDEAFDVFVQGILAYLRAHPEIDIFQLWPPDSETWCDCERCRALGGPNVRHALLVNRVAKAIEREIPGIVVECIAYRHYIAPPDQIQFENNVLVDFCPYARTYQTPISDDASAVNTFYRQLIEQWADKDAFAGDAGIYSYYRKYIWRSLPLVIPHVIAADLKYYHQIGIQGLSSYSEPADWLSYELNHYVIAQALWQADLDVNRLLDDYTENSFGAAAEMREYFSLIERAVPNATRIYQSKLYPLMKAQIEQQFDSDFAVRTSISSVIKPFVDDLDQCSRLLDSAAARELSPSQRQMLNKLQLSLQYAQMDAAIKQLCLQISERGNAAKLDEIVRRTEEMRSFLQEHRDEGIFLMNFYMQF